MAKEGERNWIPWADWSIMAATTIALVFGLLPLVSGVLPPDTARRLSSAAVSGAIVLVMGYPFALLAHYRLLFAGSRAGPRDNPEPPERWISLISAIIAVVIGGLVLDPTR